MTALTIAEDFEMKTKIKNLYECFRKMFLKLFYKNLYK